MIQWERSAVTEDYADLQKAIEAGREAREIGLAAKLAAATATSPLTGFLAQSTDRD